ncbi:MAG: 2-oxoacid:acceptor oxidoreductase family protein [Spirochaetes bacterium]|nr:2-oxoacid:acceptor oxidoreductase family protein [Spirochaetota bacterium]
MKRMIFAGYGGQGLLTLGEIVATVAMNKGKNVTWMPSYGPEMRGGTANCAVIVSEKLIGSPIVLSDIDILFAMNQASVDKFLPKLKAGALALVNSSLIVNRPDRKDVEIVEIDATNIAVEVGNLRVANMIMLAGFLSKSDMLTLDDIKSVMQERFKGARSAELVELNIKAIERGLQTLK